MHSVGIVYIAIRQSIIYHCHCLHNLRRPTQPQGQNRFRTEHERRGSKYKVVDSRNISYTVARNHSTALSVHRHSRHVHGVDTVSRDRPATYGKPSIRNTANGYVNGRKYHGTVGNTEYSHECPICVKKHHRKIATTACPTSFILPSGVVPGPST